MVTNRVLHLKVNLTHDSFVARFKALIIDRAEVFVDSSQAASDVLRPVGLDLSYFRFACLTHQNDGVRI